MSTDHNNNNNNIYNNNKQLSFYFSMEVQIFGGVRRRAEAWLYTGPISTGLPINCNFKA